MRRDWSVTSSATYQINPQHLRDLNLEVTIRKRDNAYKGLKGYERLTPQQRADRYDELKEKIRTEGFKEELPITVVLLREDGKRDKLFQGHHRLNIAIELGLHTVPVRFVL